MVHAVANAPTFVVLDDHAAVLAGTCSVLQEQYPDSKIATASTATDAETLISDTPPDLFVMDLSVPVKDGDKSQTQTGLDLLKTLLADYTDLNIVVQSAHVRSLVRLKPIIDTHQGGFTIADKSLTSNEMLTKVDWALKGLLYTPPEMRTGLEVKPEWLKVIELAFKESLTDKAIAERMHVGERTVRYYWTRVQDALQVYPDDGINIRVQTYVRAREVGLLD
ncbi:MAG: response regulator transcription factor [Leptolyngbyaceae cyanobacterium MAG.088]|nr:response regulator transcription factor [Leptolyngbyaceae cyanobacterium MAG.088]